MNKNKKRIYLLGGKDLEMETIKNVLEKKGKEIIDKNLSWGAKIEEYKQEIEKLISEGYTPVAIELNGANSIDGVIDIDHHGNRSNEKAAILQIFELEGIKPNLYQELVATNDSGFIPAMEKLLDEKKEKIELYLKNGKSFEDFKKKFIQIIRKRDRSTQGITIEQEKQAEKATKYREDYYDGNFTIVRISHSKSATITDRLFGSYKNLLVISEDGESNFFGDGKLCKGLAEKYNGSWSGGNGFGIEGGTAFWGGYVNQKELEDYLNNIFQNILLDKIFLPENNKNLTNLGKEIYKLGSFERLFNFCTISEVFIENQGKDISFELRAKKGYNIYETIRKKIFGGHTRRLDRQKEAQTEFGFENEDQSLPFYLYLKDDEKIDNKILRGLKKINSIKFEENSYLGKYYKIIKNSSFGKEYLNKAFEEKDPRYLEYSLGNIDITVQNTWQTKPGDGYFGDPGDIVLDNICNDFCLLGISGYTDEGTLKKLKEGLYEIMTPNVTGKNIEEIEKLIQQYKETLDKFESYKNREIQEKRVAYLEKSLIFAKKGKKQLEILENESQNFLEKINTENPFILTLNNKEDLKKMNILLDGKIVALYETGTFSGYFETLKSIGLFSKIDIPNYENYFSISNVEKGIKNSIEKISFSADDEYKDAYIKELKENGYEVEKIGNSGFAARNSYKIIIPTKKQKAVIIKIGDALNGNSYKEKKVGIYGYGEIDITDLDKKIEIENLINQIKKREDLKKDQEFINNFENLSKDGGITAVIKIGGDEKFQSYPNRYIKLAESKIANTQDHRQNRTHTYEIILLDHTKIEGKKSIDIKIPNEYKGIVIGKGGLNIKNISQKLGIKINVK